MTELPKKLLEMIDEEVSKRGYDRFSYAKRCTKAVAQELYADLAMAMEALEKTITQNRTKGYPTGAEWDFIIDQHKAVITIIKAKYNHHGAGIETQEQEDGE